MNTFEKSMEEVFDILPSETKDNLPVTIEKKEITGKSQATHDLSQELAVDLNDAYQQTKDNLQELIDQGKEAMEEILQIAKEGQHPRAFEVYGSLLKNVVDANKELLAVQKQMRDMDNNKNKGGDTKIDKAIFVGTAADLNKLLSEK